MKKGLLSIMTLALSIVNLALLLVLIFAIVPMANKTDSLITQICSVLNLELENYQFENETYLSIDSMETYTSTSKQTISLKVVADADGKVKDSYAIYNLSIVLNTEHEDYSKYSATISEKDALLNNTAREIVAKYTKEEFKNNEAEIRKEIVTAFRNLYRSDFIYDVQFSDLVLS